MYSEVMKKVQGCALQKDFNYISSVMESKACSDEVNESLKNKANKTSVADALQRKVNRSDFDTILEQKADMVDLENIISILEAKVEFSQFEDLAMRIGDVHGKADRIDVNRLADLVAGKANRDEVDLTFGSLQLVRSEQDKRLVAVESEIESTVRVVSRDMEDVKSQVVNSLSKKADYALIERLRESTLKKVDQDYMHQ